MRGQIPSHIDIFLEQTQIQAPCVDVSDFADVARLNNINNLADRRRIQKRVTDHEDETVSLRDFDQFFALGRRGGHRFLNEGMFPGKQASFGEWVMIIHRCGDNDRDQSPVIQKALVTCHVLHACIQRAHMLQARFTEVAHRFNMTTGQASEVADEIGTPLAASDDSDGNSASHIV